MGAMLLPMESQAASALAPVRERQMEGGEVFQKVPFVVFVSLGMLKRSKTGAVVGCGCQRLAIFVVCVVGLVEGGVGCFTVEGCGSPVVLDFLYARGVSEPED